MANNPTVRNLQKNKARVANNTGVAVTKPTGLTNGDVVYLVYAAGFSNVTAWTCSGFSSLHHSNNGTGNARTWGVLRKVITNAAGEPSTYTAVGPNSTVTNIVSMAIAVKDAHATPEDATITATAGANDFTPNAEAIVPANANALVLSFHFGALATGISGKTGGAPSTYTYLDADEQSGTSTGTFLEAASRVTTGTAPANAWTGTPDDTTAEYAVFAIAVRNGQAAPTVTFDTADNTNFGSDTTPSLEAHATDTNGDEVTYQTQIETKPIDGWALENWDGSAGLGPTALRVAQSFVGNGRPVTNATVALYKEGTITGTVTAKLYGHSGTMGTSSVPNDAQLRATSTAVNVSALGTTAGVRVGFTFPTPYTPAAAEEVTLVIEASDAATFDGSNRVLYNLDGSLPTHGGNLAVFTAGAWTPINIYDLTFGVYSSAPVFLDKTSAGAGSGSAEWVRTAGADADPYPSGDVIRYTVQAGDALADGYYRIRWRAKDPSGTDTFGAYSAYRTFIVASPITRTLDKATLVLDAKNLARTLGGITRTLDRAGAVLDAKAVTVDITGPGSVNVTLERAGLVLDAQVVARTAGAASRALGRADLVLDAKVLARTPGTVTRTLVAAGLVLDAKAIARSVAAATRTLERAGLVLTGLEVHAAAGTLATLDIAELVLTGLELDTITGAATRTLVAANLRLDAQPLGRTVEATAVELGRAGLVLDARNATRNAGLVVRPLDRAGLVLDATDLDRTIGLATRLLQRAELRLDGRPLTRTVDAAFRDLELATLLLAALGLTPHNLGGRRNLRWRTGGPVPHPPAVGDPVGGRRVGAATPGWEAGSAQE